MDGVPESPVTTYDSSGVHIVLNHAPEHADGQFWTFDAEPAFVLGGEADRAASGAIWRVRGLARLTDGRIAVLSSENRQVHLFSPSGNLVKTIGRRGEGPGEFYRPRHMIYLPPDTLMVWDEWMGHVTSLDTAGRVLERRTIDLGRALERLPEDATPESGIVPLPDGSFVVEIRVVPLQSEPPKAGTLVRHFSMRYVRLDEAYATVDLGSWPGPNHFVVPESLLSSSSPLARRFLSSWNNTFGISDVNTYITAGGRPASIYVGDGERNEIRQYALDGTLVRVVQRSTDPVPRSNRAHRAWQRNLIRYLMTMNRDASWVRPIVEAVPGKPFYPAFAGLTVDAEGHLWVREWSDSETGWPDQWSVFSPEGRWLGVVRGPPNATGSTDSDLLYLCVGIAPCWIDGDFFLALRRDEMGVERVEGYRLRRLR